MGANKNARVVSIFFFIALCFSESAPADFAAHFKGSSTFPVDTVGELLVSATNWTCVENLHLDFSPSFNVSSNETSCSDGTHTFSLFSTRSGLFHISFLLEDQVLDVPELSFSVSNVISPSQSFASGEGLYSAIAGDFTKFSVQISDKEGNAMDVCGHVSATISGHTKLVHNVVVSSCKNGLSELGYMLTAAGNFSLSVLVDELPLALSPFEVTVHAGPVSIQKTIVDGLDAVDAFVGYPFSFNLRPADEFDNPLTCAQVASQPNVVVIFGQQEVAATAEPCDDDVFTVSVIPPKDGLVLVKLKIDDVMVEEGPFELLVHPAPPYPPLCQASGDGVWGGQPNVPIYLDVQLRTISSEPISDCSRVLDVSLSPRATPPPSDFTDKTAVVQCLSGFYTVSYEAPEGEYFLHISWNGTEIKGSPFAVSVFPGCLAGQPLRCSGTGVCQDDGVCLCDHGFTSSNCSIECNGGLESPCSEHGTCQSDGACDCEQGFRGLACERECIGGAEQPCSGHGECLKDASCGCVDGFSGDDCSVFDAEVEEYGTSAAMIVLTLIFFATVGMSTYLYCQRRVKLMRESEQSHTGQRSWFDRMLLRIIPKREQVRSYQAAPDEEDFEFEI